MKLKFIDPRMFKFIDWFLIGIILLLTIFSFVAIASAQSKTLAEGTESLSDAIVQLNLYHVLQQLAWFGIGMFALFMVLIPDYHAIGEYYKWMYVIIIVLLVLVKFFGREVGGTPGWFRIGDAGFQPAEFGKIVMIITLAHLISNKTRGKDGGIKTLKDMLPIFIAFAIPFALIMWQPDWGTAFVYAFTFMSMLFIARTSIKIIIGLIAGVGISIPIAWEFMMPFQRNRIYTYFGIVQEGISDQKAQSLAHQANQAQTAVGAGQITGRGLFSVGVEARTNIPENHTDFIFASTAESIGFIGAAALLLLFFVLIFRTVYLSTKAKDDFGMLIIFGVAAMTLFHVFQNIAMNIGVMPISGIPLPFFSYGGSNLLTNMIAYGLVINVSMRRQNWGTSKQLAGGAMHGLRQGRY